ncbi:FUSC family protein [Pseudomonadota bacterium]
MLSIKAKESIKTALAMTIAYGIALSMDWDRPYWAGFAVAFVSLASIGQSMNKAAFRMFGTLVAVVVSFIFISLFAQERWAFILILSIYGGFCAYMMNVSKRAYFWQVCGFVVVIICLDAGPDPVNAFNIAILRTQETGLGILVYSLVAIFLWPSKSSATFNAAAADLAATQHQFYQACLGLMRGQGNAEEVQGLGAKEVQAKTHFDQLLDAAETDSYDVRVLRRSWRRYQHEAAELMQTMGRWRDGFTDVQSLDLQQLLPDIKAFDDELDTRLEQIATMMAGAAPGQVPQAMELVPDRDAVQSLSHFHRAALVVTRSRLLKVEQLTRSLFEAVSELKGYDTAIASAEAPPATAAVILPDLDSLANVVRYVAILWLAWLALMYVNDLPGGAGLVSFAGALGIAIVNMPQLSVSRLIVPATTSVLFAAVVYIFIMPELSSFFGLGLLIFAATFAICYLFAEPRQMLGRALGLAMFVTIASISNEQSYNFLSVANTALMFPLIFLLLAVTAYIPWSPRPERAFVRLLGRYFRSSEYMMSAVRWDQPQAATWRERWEKAFHAREIATLPAKLGTWSPHLDNWVLSDASPEQVQALMTSLQSLTYRMQQLVEQGDSPQAPYLVQHLLEDFRAWRLGIQAVLQGLAQNPAGAEGDALRARLDSVLERLEDKIKTALNTTAEGQFSDQDAEEFYRLLGAYRGVSEALVDYADNADAIDWEPWREERFA